MQCGCKCKKHLKSISILNLNRKNKINYDNTRADSRTKKQVSWKPIY